MVLSLDLEITRRYALAPFAKNNGAERLEASFD